MIGPPRTGTSWLHAVLGQSAWLSNPTKETRFFDRYFHRGVAWYGSHYQGAAEGRTVGEISPTYFASREARERIASVIPRAKVVCTFRNPVDRVLSLYRLKRALGLIPWTFEQAMDRDPELMESSRYASYLQAWRSALGGRQVMATIYDDLQRDAQSYLNTLGDFVGLPRLTLGESQIGRVLSSDSMTEPRSYYWTRGAALLAEWSRARRLGALVATAKNLGLHRFFVGKGQAFEDLSYGQRSRLHELFRPEIDKLEVLINRDLSAWKYPRKSAASSLCSP